MALFFQILFTMFIAEMGDKTQLLMIAMTSRYKLRDIIIGSALSILTLNAMAVVLGSLISQLIPTWLIKLIAGLAFFYFAWSTLRGEGDEEEASQGKASGHPILSVFGTFFLAELGDKTQLTAITFAANGGLDQALTVWLACSIGLFAADLVGMLVGHLLKSKTPEGFLDKLAFAIFAIFGVVTLFEGTELLLGEGAWQSWLIVGGAALVFVLLCLWTWRRKGTQAEK
ncbi:MAG: TMEM165/GDT1 family protein [Clostridiales bacterium]|nr:TMEM165/GDT1 family protein [Clostridiales bacterium]